MIRQVGRNARSVMVAAITTVMLMSCTGHTINDVPEFVFDQDVFRIEKNGVVLGVDPYFESEAIEKVFYVDMSKAGFYPIRLRISNLTNERLIINRSEMFLFAKTGEKYAAVPSEDVFQDLRHNSAAYGVLGFGIFSFTNAEDANAKMKADWLSKEMPRSIFFGHDQKRTGFVYFKLPKDISPESTTLVVLAENFSTQEKFALPVRLATRNPSADR